jgi:hypothetical protein
MVGIPELPRLRYLPQVLPLDNVVRIELQEGMPVFRASEWVQERIETLLEKQQSTPLTLDESRELDSYEEVDDYLSFVNRVVRNLIISQSSATPID